MNRGARHTPNRNKPDANTQTKSKLTVNRKPELGGGGRGRTVVLLVLLPPRLFPGHVRSCYTFLLHTLLTTHLDCTYYCTSLLHTLLTTHLYFIYYYTSLLHILLRMFTVRTTYYTHYYPESVC